MKTYLGFDSLTLGEIEGYLDNEWNDFLPKYQEQCIKWLIKEIKRLRNLTSKCSGRPPRCAKCNGNYIKNCFCETDKWY